MAMHEEKFLSSAFAADDNRQVFPSKLEIRPAESQSVAPFHTLFLPLKISLPFIK